MNFSHEAEREKKRNRAMRWGKERRRGKNVDIASLAKFSSEGGMKSTKRENQPLCPFHPSGLVSGIGKLQESKSKWHSQYMTDPVTALPVLGSVRVFPLRHIKS